MVRASWARMVDASFNGDVRARWAWHPERYGIEVARRGVTMLKFRALEYAQAYVMGREGNYIVQEYRTDLGEVRWLVYRKPRVRTPKDKKPRVTMRKQVSVALSNPWTGTRY